MEGVNKNTYFKICLKWQTKENKKLNRSPYKRGRDQAGLIRATVELKGQPKFVGEFGFKSLCIFCQFILPSMLRAGGASLGVVIYTPQKEIIHCIWGDCSGLGQI